MDNDFARIPDRIKAAVIDSIVLVVLMYSASEIFNFFEAVSIMVRVLVFVFIFLIYEPLLVSMFGATVGHFFNDIMVKQESEPNRNINFFRAIIRFCVKLLLGWISLLTVNGNNKKTSYS